jgi:hypothetical protein
MIRQKINGKLKSFVMKMFGGQMGTTGDWGIKASLCLDHNC